MRALALAAFVLGSVGLAGAAAAQGKAKSAATGEDFDYGELKPRGHYANDAQRAAYFKAVHYLTGLAAQRKDTALLGKTSAAVQAAARRWTEAYRPFIAPGRAPLVWNAAAKAPAYVPPPVYNWTGFYLGINGGGAWGRSDFSAPFASGSFDTSGWLAGGTIGYNWQTGPVVALSTT